MGLPTRVKYNGRICRVLYYDGDGYFFILDGNTKRYVPRKRLTFVKG